MKHFSINQVGYSSGVRGCTDQIYQVVFCNEKGLYSEMYQVGVYHNTDHELADFFKSKGYERTHVQYGACSKYTRQERKYIDSFRVVLERIKEVV